MENAIKNIRSAINKRENARVKRENARVKFISLQEKFEKKRKRITDEINEAGRIWKETEEQIPKIFF